MARLGIIGGGLAGLAVALRRAHAGDEVTLFEASTRFGGQLHSERSAEGFVVEHGAEGFVARSSAVPELASAVGVEGSIVEQTVSNSYGFDGARLIPLAPGEAARFLGFQVSTDELGRGIRSFRSGMQALTDELVSALSGRAGLHRAMRIERLERAGSGWRLFSAENPEGDSVDALVLASSAADAARLLAPEFPAEAGGLGQANTLSSVTVSLAFRRGDVEHPLDGTGFVVASEQQQQGFRACTFSSTKLPERAPAGYALLRLFFRPEADELSQLSDENWVRRAVDQLGRAIPLRGEGERAWVSRWSAALPVFDAGHRERVEALESVLAGKNLWLAGSAFHGSGIDAAVRSAEHAARALAR